MSGAAWDELWRVLDQTAALIEQGAVPGQNTLAVRTEQLARRLEAEIIPTSDTARVLFFSLGAERYGWPAGAVRAIARVGRITPVPSAPRYYRGVVSLRGQVLSVLDLRLLLGLPPASAAEPYIIVLNAVGLEIGVLADEVIDLSDLPLGHIAPASNIGLEPELVSGVFPDGATLLDAEALLRRERARIDSEEGGR